MIFSWVINSPLGILCSAELEQRKRKQYFMKSRTSKKYLFKRCKSYVSWKTGKSWDPIVRIETIQMCIQNFHRNIYHRDKTCTDIIIRCGSPLSRITPLGRVYDSPRCAINRSVREVIKETENLWSGWPSDQKGGQCHPPSLTSPVRYIIIYRLSIYRHFWKILISISIWSFLKILISIREVLKKKCL